MRDLKIIRYFLCSRLGLFIGIFLVLLVISVLEGLNVAAFFPILQSLSQQPGASVHPTNSGKLLSGLATICQRLPFHDPLVSASVLLMGITLVKCGMSFAKEGLLAYASGSMQDRLKNQIFRRYADSSYLYFLDHKQGELAHDALIAASRVGILAQKIPQFLADFLKMAAIGLLLVIILPAATLGLALFLAGYSFLVQHLSSRVSYHTGKGRVIAGAEQSAILTEFLGGVRQIMAFETTEVWLQKFRSHSRVFRDLCIRDGIWLAAPRLVMEPAAILLIVGFIARSRSSESVFQLQNMAITGVFTLALFQLFPVLTSLGRLRMEISGLVADAEPVYRALTQPPPRFRGGARTFQGLNEGIVFDRVCFAFSGGAETLKDISFRLGKGRICAVVGPSGSGKTTLVNLLLTLLEPTQGRILVDGCDLRDYSQRSWLQRIGFVSQDAFIIHASVEENIRFGRLGYTHESVREAARLAHAEEFIAQLPQGYDTVVGERGMKLSGGQQQRIAIARAILSHPEVMIFDEATSALDVHSELLIQQAMQEASQNRTVLLIAHRISSIRYADDIVVLREGRLVEQGSRQVLLEKGRYFQTMNLNS